MRVVVPVVCCLVSGAIFAATALAQSGATTPPQGPLDPNALSVPASLDGRVEAHRITGQDALNLARRDSKIQNLLKDEPRAKPEVYLKGQARWQVSWYQERPKRVELGQVIIDDRTARVTESWTGPQVAWTMARGYPGAFGRKINSPWIWIPLTLMFVLPFISPRRPLRWLHLDVAVLAAFGLSVAFFNAAKLGASVPVAMPLLLYLLARMLAIALAGRRRAQPERQTPLRPLPLLVPVSWLAVGLIFLIGFRIGLNLQASNVIDVGYSGVIGADRLADGDPLYGHFPKENESGDTYGPVAYLAYVPFEQILPWSGRWDSLWAAHAAAITFDLLTIVALLFIGRRLRGWRMGIVLAYAWTAWPFSTYVMSSNSNDGLVAALVAFALLAAARPALRGVLTMLGGLTKLVSLALLPLMATHNWFVDRRRTVLLFCAGAAAAAVFAFLPILARGESLRTVYDRTFGFQFGRDAPFSVWGYYDLTALQYLWQALVIALILLAPLLPRRQDLIGLAALSAALLIAVQSAATYWFYLYLVWFFPPLIVALLGRYSRPQHESALRPKALLKALGGQQQRGDSARAPT